jgi:hypothetical protein
VSVPTVEALLGTKARLLKAAIDLAIAVDDEPVPMLDRDWAAAAADAADVEHFLSVIAGVITPAQARSSGLVLPVFEGAGADSELGGLAAQMSAQRVTMTAWAVARIAALGALRGDVGEDEAVDTVYALMEPAVFDRLTRQRGWTPAHYREWVARSLRHLLVAEVEKGAVRGAGDVVVVGGAVDQGVVVARAVHRQGAEDVGAVGRLAPAVGVSSTSAPRGRAGSPAEHAGDRRAERP